MHASFQKHTTTKAPQASPLRHKLETLPTGAIQLDTSGHILHRMTSHGFAEEPRCTQVAGESVFEMYFEGTPLAYLTLVYQEGVRLGELYHFVDVTIGEGTTARDLTVFLYYHAATNQGWIFIEPHADTVETTTTMNKAA
jgi:hypothetical protein